MRAATIKGGIRAADAALEVVTLYQTAGPLLPVRGERRPHPFPLVDLAVDVMLDVFARRDPAEFHRVTPCPHQAL